MISLFLLSLFFGHHPKPLDHAVYVSVLEVNLVEEEVSILVKVFEDDFRDALRLMTGNICNQLSVKDSIEILDYFGEHLKVNCPAGPIELNFGSIQQEGDAYQIHLRGGIALGIKVLSIQADYLMELFPDQRNILHFTENGEKQFKMLLQESTLAMLN